MNIKKLLINSVIVVLSSVIGLLLCEVGARSLVNPGDLLSVSMVNHEILGHVVEPKTVGFDKWGFRNRSVPTKVDIVALGDSHTYGNTARMVDSWPYVLGQLTGKGVYNMGLGGYGPNQYYYLFKTRALAMRPKVILIGLYMGDDFENAFSITYGLEYWSFLRQGSYKGVNPYVWEHISKPSWHKEIRIWLSRHSVIYQIVFHGPLLGKIIGEVQIEHASRLYDGAVSLNLGDKNIREAFLPGSLVPRLDQGDQRIKEGMRITFTLLSDMAKRCVEDNIQFVVVVLPTKEMVFSDYLEHNPTLPLHEMIDTLLRNERSARGALFHFLKESNIHYVDTLPTLKQSVGKELYARTGFDMHPNRNGYRIISNAVYDSIKEMGVITN